MPPSDRSYTKETIRKKHVEDIIKWMDSLDSNGILYTDSTNICAEDYMIEPRIPEKSLPTPRNALQRSWKRNLYDSALKCQRYVSSAFHFFENDRSQFRNVSGHFLIVLDLFPENCDIYHKNHDTYHKICIMKIVVHIQISRNRSKQNLVNEMCCHIHCRTIQCTTVMKCNQYDVTNNIIAQSCSAKDGSHRRNDESKISKPSQYKFHKGYVSHRATTKPLKMPPQCTP